MYQAGTIYRYDVRAPKTISFIHEGRCSQRPFSGVSVLQGEMVCFFNDDLGKNTANKGCSSSEGGNEKR